MIVENLTNENVEELKNKLVKMQEDNPEIKYQLLSEIALQKATYDVRESLETERIYDRLERIVNKLDNLERKIDLIFDDHILINGKMVKIKIKEN